MKDKVPGNEGFDWLPGETEKNFWQNASQNWAWNLSQCRWQRATHGWAWDWEREFPALKPVDWKAIAKTGPKSLRMDRQCSQPLPKVKAVVIFWNDAEWAAMDHVWGNSHDTMKYRYWEHDEWERDWTLYRRGYDEVVGQLPWTAPSRWENAWCKIRLVSLARDELPILLVKSHMHLSTDGPSAPLRFLIERIILESKPYLVLTTGTAGGTRDSQMLGTVVVSNSARFQLEGALNQWSWNNGLFTSSWQPSTRYLEPVQSYLYQVPPVTMNELEILANKMNLPLEKVMNRDVEPRSLEKNTQILTGTPSLTTNAYVSANTSGNYAEFSCMEMNDAVVAMVCQEHHTHFGSVRNISDPIVNASLKPLEQLQWSQMIYSTYGWHSSLNSALATWALLADEFG